jgi:hypothetical protein
VLNRKEPTHVVKSAPVDDKPVERLVEVDVVGCDRFVIPAKLILQEPLVSLLVQEAASGPVVLRSPCITVTVR